MKIERYSLNGFTPQFQKHHLENVNYHLCRFSEKDFPEHLRYHILLHHQKMVPFYKEHLSDFKKGIWAFISGHKNNQSLNHLKRNVPCWEADIDDSAEVFDVNWTEKILITNPLCEVFGCYIPARELSKITNIKRKLPKRL